MFDFLLHLSSPSSSWLRYGLGMVYYRQEKYELAQFHFERALEIHPGSPALRCYVGMVWPTVFSSLVWGFFVLKASCSYVHQALHMRQQYDEALAEFDHAIRLSYKNPLLRFKRAKTLAAMGKYQVLFKDIFSSRLYIYLFCLLTHLFFCFCFCLFLFCPEGCPWGTREDQRSRPEGGLSISNDGGGVQTDRWQAACPHG